MATIGRLAYQVVADVQQFAQGMVATRAELREARRAFVETRTPAEQFGMALDALAKQHRKGVLDADLYRRRVAQITREHQAAISGTNKWTDALQQAGIGTRILSLATNPLALGIAGVAAAATGSIAAVYGLARAYETFVKPQADAIEMTLALSERLGLSTSMLSALGHAAKMSEVEQGTFVKGLQTMTRRLSEAATKGGETAKMIKALGLDAKQLDQAGAGEALLQISDAISKLPTQGQKAQAAFALFGRSGVEMVGMLQQGREGLQGWMQDAQELGIVFSKSQAEMVDAANDARDRLGAALKGVATIAAIELAPAIQAVAEWLIEIVKNPVTRGSLADAFRLTGGALVGVAELTHSWLSSLFEAQKLVLRIQLAFAKIAGNKELVAESQRAIDGLNQAIENSPAKKFMEIMDGRGAGGNSGAFTLAGLGLEEVLFGETQANAAKDATEAMRSWAEVAKQGQQVADSMRTAQERHADTFEHLTQLMSVGAITWDTYRRAVAEANKELRNADPALKAIQRAMGEAAAAGKRIFDATRTPQEQFAKQVEDLQSLLQVGAIDFETYMRAIAQAGADFRKSQEAMKPADTPAQKAAVRDSIGGPSVHRLGTAEAFAAIERNRTRTDKPNAKLEEIGKSQLTVLESIEEAMQQNAIQVRVMGMV